MYKRQLTDSAKSSALTLYSKQSGDSSYETTMRGGRECVYSPEGKKLYFDAAEEFLYGAAPRGIEITVEYFDAVSYTHLDVYKRQHI